MTIRQREYIRHPVDIPIEVHKKRRRRRRSEGLSNLSLGGLAFFSDCRWSAGETLTIVVRVPFDLEISGTVVWCDRRGGHFEVGMTFGTPAEAYKGRMIEQICHIEQYRQEVERQQGRQLSLEQAASEWIARFADRFAQEGWQTGESETDNPKRPTDSPFHGRPTPRRRH